MSEPQALPLAGRVALVSGAVEGIGRAACAWLAARGAHVVVAGRVADDRLDARVAELHDAGGSAEGLAMDVTDPESVQAAFQSVFRAHRRLDVLVANAGALGDARLGMITEDLLHTTLEANLAGAIRQVQGAARLMQRNRSGSVVVVGSIMGLRGNAGQVPYASAKAGLVGLVRSAAKELAPAGVRVNLVAPGFIETRLTADLDDGVRTERIASIGMGRAGTPEDVAEVIGFLASDASGYVTGQIIGVDGGMVL